MKHALITENIEKRFANHLALDDVSIQVPEASIYGLLGPNGAGKTTLIRIINQITAPDKGKVYFNGEPISSKHISLIGYLPEERGLYKKMKVGEQALYLCQLKGLSRQDALKGLKKWFEKFEIQSWWDKKVEELSKGMAQKVQFIITVLHNPTLLIFDEPFSGFDPINANLLKQEILELKRNGATIIFSTHNMSSVEEICDYVALINRSRKVLEGEINEVRTNYASNIYEIQFEGFLNIIETSLSHEYKILKVEKNLKDTIIEIELLNNNLTSNDILKRFLEFGNISMFRRYLPKMEDVFIKVVGETNSLTE
ncbi:MAG: ATP-binding cassette domain-containing protein [Bacteroidales bacterium]|jgi:ABC-2 type transport system ATP-binding protein|nr:ATP-binding cassette domain-containing protein [Bacteroidales bacterium]HOL98351.1 ATP-binding cassette domain-containing protein [Bacteroidales bacterium]HOM35711.1 ATP-binding cassette domain-containing protein [Bacteroidales bacterium]HPD23149.1 ATP-binding cassette domain-containing protein [Bacteroidales bacterium]HRS99078.1 ATP-binding cassette domain-containing protein [Bacteroidales bacterium]